MSMAERARKERAPYQKVLYLRQSEYPSNYVDASFLSDLQRNVNVSPVHLAQLLLQTLPPTQHLCSTFIFVATFIALHSRAIDPNWLLIASGILVAFLRIFTPNTNSNNQLIPLTILYLLSPALKTLTRATTSDSIYALATTLLSFNLFLPFPSTLSLTASISASTVLASRLDSNKAVFSLLLFATIWFGLVPQFRAQVGGGLRAGAVGGQENIVKPVLVTVGMAITAIAALRFVGVGAGPERFAVAAIVGVGVGVPLFRGWLMVKYKDRIRGPWDQAVPRVHAAT
ncbi:GPI2-domain-containing protein [Meredithblackwellia eburnea MCA 4105]